MIENKTKPTVLIVDDTKFNIELMSSLLKDTFEIEKAHNGIEALDLMRQNPKAFDAVLLDMIMPGLNGCDVLEHMNNDPVLNDIPVIVLTSDDDPYTKLRAFDLGALDFVQRGSDVTVIKHRIINVIRLNKFERASSNKEQIKTDFYKENRFTAFMDNIPGGVAVLRTNGEHIECSYFNNELLMLFGMTAEEFRAQFVKSYRAEWVNTFLHEGIGAKHYTYTFAIGDVSNPKSCQWIRLISGKLGESNGIRDIYCVFLDVNDEKHHEMLAKEAGEKLRENEDKLENVLDNAPGGIVYAERDSYGKMNVVFANQGMAEMLGYPDLDSCMQALCTNPNDGVSEEDIGLIRNRLDRALEKGLTLKHSFNYVSNRGEILWLMVTAKPMLNAEGRLSLYAFVNNVTKEKQFENELRTVAYYDPMTGLFNRSAFMKSVRMLLQENPLMEYSLIMLNIGGFKTINDLMGRDTGDLVLKTVAKALGNAVGDSGITARFFADNFCILVPYSERSVHPQSIINSLQKAVLALPEINHEIQFYLGIYKITDKSISVESMTDRASIACRLISGSFHEHIAYYDEKMRLQMLEEQEIIDDSRRALKNREFVLYYQPVYGIKAKKFVSAEALVRWIHPEKGMISPGKFIPVFEKNGFIAELDLYILEQVCIYQKKRRDEGLEPFPISVNVSRMSLYNPRLFELINALTTHYGVSPEFFRIEITESAYNDNPAQLLETVGKLREAHYPVLMDDFGSGYSSLNTLKDIPIDVLKLDMKFMQGFETNEKVGTIVTAISRMSKWLSIPMLAEGVETRDQYEFLSSIGCSYIQGYYFSRPIPEQEFTETISREVSVAGNESKPLDVIQIGEDDINELLGGNPLVSKFLGSVFGGLGIYEMIDGRLELIRANEGYLNIMGYPAHEAMDVGVNAWEHVYPDDVKISFMACMEASRTDKAVYARIRRFSNSGELMVLDGVHRRLGGTDEHPIFCIAFNDVTQTVRNDEIVRNTRERTEQLIAATDAMFAEIDFEDKSVYRIGPFSQLGFEVNTFGDIAKLEQYLKNNVHPQDADLLYAFYKDITSERISQELRIRNSEERYQWWRLTQVRSFDENGNIIRVIFVATFINSEKADIFRLEQVKEGLETAIDNTSTGIMAVEFPHNDVPRVLYSNDGFWKTIGRKRMPGTDFVKLVYKGEFAESVRQAADSVHKDGKFVTDYTITDENGRKSVIQICVSASRWGNMNDNVFMFYVADITERYENREIFTAIVENSGNGIAFVNASPNGYTIEYANDRFYEFVCVEKGDVRLDAMIADIIDTKIETRDMHVRRGNDGRIIRTKLVPVGEDGYIITVNDVTKKRAELKDRINERMENSAAGLYDVVFELNLKKNTVKTVSSRKAFAMPLIGKPMPFDVVVNGLTEKFVYPDDVKRLKKLFAMPFESPDFTDAYREIRFRDTEQGNDKCIVYGVTIVRSRTDTCMMFCRDKSKVDRLEANAKVADLTRLYRLVAERAKITLIEWDHVTNRTICTPSIEEYWAAKLSPEEFYEQFRDGLAVHDDDKKLFSEFMEKVMASSASLTETVRLKMADGSFKWCDLTISITRSANGKIMRSLCIIKQLDRDDAENKRQNRGMRLLHKTVGNIPVGLGIFCLEDAKPVPIYVSDSVYDIFGIKSKDMDIPVLPVESLAKRGLAVGNQGRITLESMKVDGTAFQLGVKYRVAEEDGETLIYAVFSDITGELEVSRRSTAEYEMYSMLLCETGTIIFNYSPSRDEFTYMDYGDISKKNTIATIAGFSQNVDKLSMLDEDDRQKLALGLQKLCNGEKQLEMIVRLNVDGYLHRFRVHMKSVEDENSEMFMIIGKMEDVEDELVHIEKIEAKAKFDPLCVDIYNKATTEQLIKAELERGTGGILMMLDIDDFKSINDNLGHLFGDEFLKRFASAIKSEFRTTDIIGRYGGDEFIVFLPRASASLARKKGWHILEKVSEIEVPQLGSVKSSIGAAVINSASSSYSEALKQADTALYQAKNTGKNRFEMFDVLTMSEGSYRVKESEDSARHGAASVELSSNPSGAASLVMRVFSTLYSSTDVDAGISQTLELLGNTFDVSRVYIFENSENGESCSNTFEWCGDGVAPCIKQLQNVSYQNDLNGEFLKCFNDDGIFYCQDIAALDPVLTGFLDVQSIKSLLLCEISDGGKFKGFVGFDECRNNRFWTQEQVDSLVFLSKIISVFLLKGRSEQRERLT